MTGNRKGAIEIETTMKIILAIVGIGALALLIMIISAKLMGDTGATSQLANASNMSAIVDKYNWEI